MENSYDFYHNVIVAFIVLSCIIFIYVIPSIKESQKRKDVLSLFKDVSPQYGKYYLITPSSIKDLYDIKEYNTKGCKLQTYSFEKSYTFDEARVQITQRIDEITQSKKDEKLGKEFQKKVKPHPFSYEVDQRAETQKCLN